MSGQLTTSVFVAKIKKINERTKQKFPIITLKTIQQERESKGTYHYYLHKHFLNLMVKSFPANTMDCLPLVFCFNSTYINLSVLFLGKLLSFIIFTCKNIIC